MKFFNILVLLFLSSFTTLAMATEAKGPVVDLGTLDIEGESRQPNLQFIEPPAIKHAILQKVFTQSVKNVEATLLNPASSSDLMELKRL